VQRILSGSFSKVIAGDQSDHIPIPFAVGDRVGFLSIPHHPFFLLHPDHIHLLDGLK
jgi:hypothetical protein